MVNIHCFMAFYQMYDVWLIYLDIIPNILRNIQCLNGNYFLSNWKSADIDQYHVIHLVRQSPDQRINNYYKH